MLKMLKISVAVLALAGSGASHANLISNGGFESGSFAGWTTNSLACSGVGATAILAVPGCYGIVSEEEIHRVHLARNGADNLTNRPAATVRT